MVIPAQMQHTVDNGLDQILGVLGTNNDITELPRPRRRPRLIHRKAQNVSRLIPPAMLHIQPPNRALIDEVDGHVTIADTRGA